MTSPRYFHLPVDSIFFTGQVNNQMTTFLQIVEDFPVPEHVLLAEFDANREFHLWMFWLQDKYQELVEADMYEVASRAYMLPMMACTFFADKSGGYIDV